MKVLFVGAEAVPFVKTGGLADVIGSLPKALRELGVDVRVILPKYASISSAFTEAMTYRLRTTVQVGWRRQYCGVEKLVHQGITFYFVDNEYYFKRPEIYTYDDNAERYAFFSRAVLAALPGIDFQPDVIHCHDWHAGLIPVLLGVYRRGPFYEKMRSVFTIHNLQYQGVFPKEILPEVLGLDWSFFRSELLEFYGGINFLKAGLVFADKITTVSRSYAEEITEPFWGERLDGVLRARKGDLVGIVNGIDYEEYNPEKDPALAVRYNADTCGKKQENKEALQAKLGLPVRADVPMLAIVSRLVRPKGLDLIMGILEELLEQQDIQLVVLGTGEKQYEHGFADAAHRHPDKVAACLLFDESLARMIYGGADLLVMPSLFEPCGISQLIALRYGTLPVVRETGGLQDTVQPYNQYNGEGNGFSFANYNAHELLSALQRALSLYHENRPAWDLLRQNAMRSNHSWQRSAEEYLAVYQGIQGSL